MPNLNYFIDNVGEMGDKVGIYTNLSLPISNIIANESMSAISYVQASYHPEMTANKNNEKTFFDNIGVLKREGVSVILRFVGVPHLLHMLPTLKEKCIGTGIQFFPTTLLSPDYPRSYSDAEKSLLASYMVGYSSLIQLDGGALVSNKRCFAGNRLFSARLYQTGDIYPCISVSNPVIGNIFNNQLFPLSSHSACFREDKLCVCDIHFQQSIVEGIDDSLEYEKIMGGLGNEMACQYGGWKERHNIITTNKIWSGMGNDII